MRISSILFALSLLASASAHGWVSKLTVPGGKSYSGNKPTQEQPSTSPSPIRQIATNLPVKDVTSPDLTCGASAAPASQVATVKAGDTLQMNWKTLMPNGLWFHDVGPMITYLADCGDAGCAKFDASGAKFFKIAQLGQDKSGAWYQANLDTGAPANVTIPSNIKPGNYLMRHELIALHTAQSPGGAEFYPSCLQLTVTGGGSGAPTFAELVSFPGAYSAQDKGILIDVYDMTSAYTFPGPTVAAFVSPSSSSSNSGSAGTGGAAAAAGTTKAASKTTSTAAASKATGTKASSSSPKAPPTCKARRSRRAASPQPALAVDAAANVHRSRMHNMHRAAASF